MTVYSSWPRPLAIAGYCPSPNTCFTNSCCLWPTAVPREAFWGLGPQQILTRRKMGFPVPVGRWLRGPFWPVVQEFVLGPRALERGLFHPAFLRRLAEEHRSGRSGHSNRLWILINSEIWQRSFLEG